MSGDLEVVEAVGTQAWPARIRAVGTLAVVAILAALPAAAAAAPLRPPTTLRTYCSPPVIPWAPRRQPGPSRPW